MDKTVTGARLVDGINFLKAVFKWKQEGTKIPPVKISMLRKASHRCHGPVTYSLKRRR
jgi:hypothetical protein